MSGRYRTHDDPGPERDPDQPGLFDKPGYQPPTRVGDPDIPKPGTRKAKVLQYLIDHEWAPVWEINTPEVGGTSGDRRLRELREDGWDIESRPTKGRSSNIEHRLANVWNPF